MAVMMILEWQDVSAEDYDRVNQTIGISGDADAPDGLIEHVAALTEDDELVIVDLWESDEALGRFVDTRLGPAIEQLGLSQPEHRTAQVHNHEPGHADEGNVLVLIEVPDTTTDQYDAMHATMPSHRDEDAEHPWHVHVAATDGDTLVVADMWPSAEQFGRFADEQILPAAEQAGVSGVDHRVLRVHNRIRGSAASAS